MNEKAKQGLIEYRRKIKSGEIERKKRPSLLQAVKKKCKWCMSDYQNGRLDCGIPSCSLYHWMPYKAKDIVQP